tara:strand:+ start:663 stop:869 length:207 start_codon:yes stop_codon:yes gene_type:complete
MIHYLVIGHACDEEQGWRHMMFNDEQPDKYLEAKFIQRVREDSGWDEDKEIYVDFILKSNSIIDISYG